MVTLVTPYFFVWAVAKPPNMMRDGGRSSSFPPCDVTTSGPVGFVVVECSDSLATFRRDKEF